MKRSQGSRRFGAVAAMLAMLVAPAAAGANNATGSAFAVNIMLNAAPQDVCIGEALSASTDAVVQVACAAAPFARIDASTPALVATDPLVGIGREPARPVIGSQGGGFRCRFAGRSDAGGPAYQCLDWFGGTGTVASLRINKPGGGAPLELLVSF